MEKKISVCDFGRIPTDLYPEVLKALEVEDWQALAKFNFNYGVCPWVYCCNGDKGPVLKIFNEAKDVGYFD